MRRWVVVVVVVLAVAAGVFGGAHLMTPWSGTARAIAWMEADTGDIHRFPSAPVRRDPALSNALRDARLADARRLRVPTGPGGTDQPLGDLLADTGTTALLISQGDRLLVEEYLADTDRTTPRTSFSVAKSVLSALVGIAVEDGRIRSLDDPVTTYVPELAERDPRFGDITIRHLLTMTSGLRYDERGTPWSDDARTYYAPDLYALALARSEVVEAPGRRWHYNNYNPLLLGLVLERATGRTVPAFTAERLWQPLGPEADASWSLDREGGAAKLESGFNARPVDFLRFARLYVDGGRVGGRQVLPSTWVQESLTSAVRRPGGGYGLLWWIEDDGTALARGNHGQLLWVDPARDVVVARFGDRAGRDDWPQILPRLAEAAIAAEG